VHLEHTLWAQKEEEDRLIYKDKMLLKCAVIEWVVYSEVSCITAPSKRSYCDVNNTANYSAKSAVEKMSNQLIINKENIKRPVTTIKLSFQVVDFPISSSKVLLTNLYM